MSTRHFAVYCNRPSRYSFHLISLDLSLLRDPLGALAVCNVSLVGFGLQIFIGRWAGS